MSHEPEPFLAEDFWASPPLSPGMLLLEALEEKNYREIYRQIRQLKEPLQDIWAGRCLVAALSCKGKAFRAVLDVCAPGEYVEEVQWREERLNGFVKITGTILAIAAGMNLVEPMKLLLERGYSVNGDAPEAAERAERHMNIWIPHSDTGVGHLTIGDRENNSYWNKCIGNVLLNVHNCSPLAAAIACGSMEAVRLLLRRPGIRVAESPSVCRAALWVSTELHANSHEDCVRECFGLKEPSMYLRGELLKKCVLAPEAYVEDCMGREFWEELERRRFTPKQAEALARQLSGQGRIRELRKLNRMIRYYPEACMTREVRENVLESFLATVTEKRPQEERLRLWKKLCGPVRDITLPKSCEYTVRSFWDIGEMTRNLRRMAEGGELRCDAESFWAEDLRTVKALRCALKYVKFSRSTTRGISSLAMNILEQGSVRLLKEAAALGALDNEPREELLAYAMEQNADAAFRAAILSLCYGQPAGEANGNPVRGCFWSARWAKATREEKQAWLKECWEQPLGRDACRERVETSAYDDGFDRDEFSGFRTCREYRLDEEGLTFDNIEVAACCGRNPVLLEVLLDRGLPDITWNLDWEHGGGHLEGSALCIAAATGRLEQVKLLLDAGKAVNDGRYRSHYSPDGDDWWGEKRHVVTPLHMALRNGHTEVAEYLRARGGICYPEWKEDAQPASCVPRGATV